MSNLSEAKFVNVGGQTYAIGDEVSSLEEVKRAVVAQLDSSVANADPVLEGDTVYFRYKAGTKGSI